LVLTQGKTARVDQLLPLNVDVHDVHEDVDVEDACLACIEELIRTAEGWVVAEDYNKKM